MKLVWAAFVLSIAFSSSLCSFFSGCAGTLILWYSSSRLSILGSEEAVDSCKVDSTLVSYMVLDRELVSLIGS